MEHYAIFIWHRSLSDQDHKLVSNILRSIFLDELQYHSVVHFAEEIATLLKPALEYIAVLNACQESENVEWTLIDNDFNVKDFISKEVFAEVSESEYLTEEEVEHISTLLHALADQLPAFGTYKLDVLLGSDVLRNLSVSKEPVLAGAFIRLTRWHSAHFTIFEQTNHDVDKLNEWCEIINAHVFQRTSTSELGPSLWRGAVSINTTDQISYEGFELKLDIEEKTDNFQHFRDIKKDLLERIVLSSKLEVIHEVSFASILPYLISPVKFRLILGNVNVFNENSIGFIHYLFSHKEIAFIMKLEYAEINAQIKPEKTFCTSRWQKAISHKSVKDPQCFVSFNKFIIFAVTKSKISDSLIAYPLEKTTLDAHFYFSIINHKTSSHQNTKASSAETSEENILTGIPLVNSESFPKLLSNYVINQKEDYLECTNEQKYSHFLSLLEDMRNSSTPFSYGADTKVNFLLEEIDPSDWPERIQLLNKQMQNEAKECIPASSLIGHNLKLPQQYFSFSSDFITKCFTKSGESKNVTNLESIQQLKSDHPEFHDFNKVLQSLWPEIMDCTYHDIYYNSNCQIEDKESLGCQMIKLYVQQETASTCNNQQICQNISIFRAEKSLTPSREFRSPSCRTTKSESKIERFNTSPRENSLKELITKKILLTSRSSSTENISELNKNSNAKNKKNLNKSLAPVRCSPRKKNPVNYKYTAIKRNINAKNAKHSKSNEIPDVLKKKIRHAVATALENNGIAINHDFFKPCGSKLFSICKTFLDDLTSKKGKTSEYLQKIADAHVKQVIEFYQG